MKPSPRSPYRSRKSNPQASQANLPSLVRVRRFLGLNERRVAFVTAMQCRDDPALLGFLDLGGGRLSDGFAFLSAGEHLANSFCHLAAPLGITRKLVPYILFRLAAARE